MESSPSSSSGRGEQTRSRVPGAGSASAHVTQLPLARVKLIIKTDPDMSLASWEATILITKATELFISHLARRAHHYTVQSKRKTLQKRDIDTCLPVHDELAFLEGALDT